MGQASSSGRSAGFSLCTLALAIPVFAAPPDTAAQQLINTACTTCHTLDVITAQRRTPAQWQAQVANMIQRGAPLTQQQSAAVVNYLSQNFSKKDRARDLFEDSCSSCHTLARIRDYAYTKEEWREETRGMLSEGTVLTDEELDLLLNYLAKNFGPPKQDQRSKDAQ